jgi:hypothetical protein
VNEYTAANWGVEELTKQINHTLTHLKKNNQKFHVKKIKLKHFPHPLPSQSITSFMLSLSFLFVLFGGGTV